MHTRTHTQHQLSRPSPMLYVSREAVEEMAKSRVQVRRIGSPSLEHLHM